MARSGAGSLLSPALDALFPPRCAGCRRGPWPFCEICHEELLPIEPPWCIRCARPTERDVDGCAWCPPPPVDGARSAFVFRGPARAALHRLKFGGWRAVARALGAAMARVAGADPGSGVVCWVPVSRLRLAERGYDQAGALAVSVAELLRLPAEPLLARARDPGPQARRGGAERRAAMRGCFRAGARPPERVLLIDDVLTTGATAAECAAVLSRAGAREIHLLTAARAVPGRLPARYTRRQGSRPGLWLPGDAPR